MWPGGDSESAANAASPVAALAAGLAPRPLRQSIAEIHEHELRHPAIACNPVGVAPDREAALLSGWARAGQ
jgi:2'-hydroxyisoflavone reductase